MGWIREEDFRDQLREKDLRITELRREVVDLKLRRRDLQDELSRLSAHLDAALGLLLELTSRRNRAPGRRTSGTRRTARARRG